MGQRPVGALERSWRWCQRQPAVAALTLTLLLTLATMLSHQPGSADLALCTLDHAQLLREDLARRFPRDPRRRADVLAVRGTAALILRDQGRLDEALTLELDVLAERKKLADENPSVTRYQLEWADTHQHVGVLYSRRKDRDRSRLEYEQARDIFARLLRREPDNAYYQKLLGDSWFNISVAYRNQERLDAERQALEQSRTLLAALVQRDPDNAEVRNLLARTLSSLGNVLGAPLGRHDDAVEVFKQGALHARAALKLAPHVGAYREVLNANLGNWGWLERHHGRTAQAVAVTLERRPLWAGNAAELYRVAADLAEAVALAKTTDEAARYAELTLETLGQARAAGFHDARRLRQEKAFDAVRDRADFQRLLAECAETQRP